MASIKFSFKRQPDRVVYSSELVTKIALKRDPHLPSTYLVYGLGNDKSTQTTYYYGISLNLGKLPVKVVRCQALIE